MKPKVDQEYLIKLKSQNWKDADIAKRLSCTVQEVEAAWEGICASAAQTVASGYPQLAQQWLALCNQYQLVGISLRAIGEGIHKTYSAEEIRQFLLASCDGEYLTKEALINDVVENLFRNAIILRPFVSVNPAKVLEDTIKSKAN